MPAMTSSPRRRGGPPRRRTRRRPCRRPKCRIVATASTDITSHLHVGTGSSPAAGHRGRGLSGSIEVPSAGSGTARAGARCGGSSAVGGPWWFHVQLHPRVPASSGADRRAGSLLVSPRLPSHGHQRSSVPSSPAARRASARPPPASSPPRARSSWSPTCRPTRARPSPQEIGGVFAQVDVTNTDQITAAVEAAAEIAPAARGRQLRRHRLGARAPSAATASSTRRTTSTPSRRSSRST